MKNIIFFMTISITSFSFAPSPYLSNSCEELSNMASPNNSGSSSSNASPLSRKDRLSAERRNAFSNAVLAMQIAATITEKQPERTRHAALGNVLGQPRRN